ncbi:MAG: hypothetical protein V4510_04105 [bacterium]
MARAAPKKPKGKARSGGGTITRDAPHPRQAATPPPVADPDRDYLVIYEETDPDGLPADDVLVLDIESSQQQRGEMDVQQKLDIGLTNTTSRAGTAGFIITVLGSVLGASLLVYFASIYPAEWYRGGSAVRTTIALATISLILLVVGTILTHYGRRIKARGELKDVRIVEKESQQKMAFE